MKKKVLFFVFILAIKGVWAQKYQRVAYIDMEYILQNIPQYVNAQNLLDTKVKKWKADIDKQTRQMEVLKTDLADEKAILTKDLIQQREEDIAIKHEDLRRLELQYFGPNGKMYTLRKQLVQPIQDQVYNAIQNIAKRKKYDFVFDKSDNLVMLYSNKKYDISPLVLKIINIDKKRKDKKAKQIEKANAKDPSKELTRSQIDKIDKRAKRREILKKRRDSILKVRRQKKLLLQKKRDSLRQKNKK